MQLLAPNVAVAVPKRMNIRKNPCGLCTPPFSLNHNAIFFSKSDFFLIFGGVAYSLTVGQMIKVRK